MTIQLCDGECPKKSKAISSLGTSNEFTNQAFQVRYPDLPWSYANDAFERLANFLHEFTSKSLCECERYSSVAAKIHEDFKEFDGELIPFAEKYDDIWLSEDLKNARSRARESYEHTYVNQPIGVRGDFFGESYRNFLFLYRSAIEREDWQLISDMWENENKYRQAREPAWAAMAAKRQAEIERDERAMKVSCPVCGSDTDQKCVIQSGYNNSGKRRTFCHADRLRAADNLIKAGDES